MLSFMAGCVTAGGKVPKTTLAESTAENQSKPTLSYYSNFLGSYRPHESNSSLQVAQELLEELHKSQYFKEITRDDSRETDIQLNVSLEIIGSNQGVENARAFSGQTIFFIPLWGTDHYQVTAQVKNKKGLRKEYVVNDSATGIFWLPLVVFLPFTYDREEYVRTNMSRNIIQKMYEDGFIEEN